MQLKLINSKMMQQEKGQIKAKIKKSNNSNNKKKINFSTEDRNYETFNITSYL